MKKQTYFKSALSLFLCLILLFSSIATTLAVSDNFVDYSDVFTPENLFENGDFSKSENSLPLGWTVYDEKSADAFSVSLSGKTPDNNNALTFKTTKDFSDDVHAGRYFLWNNRAIIIKQNTTYTISFYIKTQIPNIRVYMYEPHYETLSGVAYREDPVEGINIYTYDTDNGYTRVSRTDVQHVKSLSDGTILPGTNSMTVLESTKGWIKYTHTFTTGNMPEHEAKIRYGFLIPGDEKGKTVSLGGFTAIGEEKNVSKTYTPLVNNGSFGFVEPVTVENGKNVTITAIPADGRVFEGWYKNGNFVTDKNELTFVWNDGVDPDYEARFAEGSNDNLVKFESFEGYQNMEMITERFGRQKNNWSLAANGGLSFENVYATNLRAHSGSKSVRINAGGSYVGYSLENLEPNTEYAFAAYAWLPSPSTAKTFKLEEVLVLPKGKAIFENSELAYSEQDVLASKTDLLTGNNAWQRFAVTFETDANGTATIWLKHTTHCYMYLDDIAVFKPVTVNVNANWGGTAAAIPSGIIVKNTSVKFIAKPYAGNYFTNWEKDASVYKTAAEFSEKVNSNISITANFDGFNTTTEDLFAKQGFDGTFENGTIPGWYATHKNAADAASVGHCSYSVSNRHAYRGEYSLRASAYHRSTILPLTGLKENTDYRFSFYYLYEDNGEQTLGGSGFSQNAVVGKDDIDLSTANIVYDEISYQGILPNSGWHKADFYFNTGDKTAVNYLMYYGTSDFATGCIFFDNMTLTEYTPSEKIENADFSDVTVGGGRDMATHWITEATPTNDALELDRNQNAYQVLKTNTNTLYTVKLMAKGSVRAATVDLVKTTTESADLLSSVSYVDCNSNEFKEYTFKFYSSAHKAVKLMFESLADNSFIDDISVTSSELSAGGIVEKIDFESDRFDFATDSDTAFTIVNDKSKALSGNAALKLSPDSTDEQKNKFLESYMGFRSITGVSYTVSVNYKAESGEKIYISPDIAERYCVKQGFVYNLKNKWQNVKFHFTTLDDFNIKALLSAITKKTKGDVYFDDIVISARMPLINGYNLEKTYCDELYNLADYYSFENFSTNSTWGKLPKGFTIKKDKNAFTSTHIMSVKSGSKKVFVFDAKPGTVYELGVSLRGNKNTNGSVSVTIDSAGKYYYTDENDISRSVITSSKNGKWKREAFSFSTTASGKIYVVFECNSGVMDIDNFTLFESPYATLVDNNDYIGRRNYNYKNPTYLTMPAGNYQNDYDGFWASLGDFVDVNNIIAFMLIVLTVVLYMIILKRRKEKYHE